MNKVYQTKTVIFNTAGEIVQRGNCFAAAIASIMELPITEVPNVETLFGVNDTLWIEVIQAWLTSMGWELMTDDRYAGFQTGSISHEDYEAIKDTYYLVSGKSARGVSHICVFKNGQLVHDPHPSGDGLETIERFQTLEKFKS